MKKYIVTDESIEKLLIFLRRTKDAQGKCVYTGDACKFIMSELRKESHDLSPIKEGLDKIGAWAYLAYKADASVDVNVILKGIEEKAEYLIREHLEIDE